MEEQIYVLLVIYFDLTDNVRSRWVAVIVLFLMDDAPGLWNFWSLTSNIV